MVSNLVAFTIVAMLIVMVPGPDFAIVVHNALTSGRRAGITTAAGIVCGVLVHASAATAGLSLLLKSSPAAFAAVKTAGAAYLVVRGTVALYEAARGARPAGEPAPHADPPAAAYPPAAGTCERLRGAASAYRQGMLTNVLNPKAALFFVSLMPQFIPEHAATLLWVPVLTAVIATIAFGWFSLISLLVARLSRALARPAVTRAIAGTTGVALLGLGVRLALQSR